VQGEVEMGCVAQLDVPGRPADRLRHQRDRERGGGLEGCGRDKVGVVGPKLPMVIHWWLN
jgi:hypothetical protein